MGTFPLENTIKWVVGDAEDRELKTRRLFLDEARRRLLLLLCDLRVFVERFGVSPPCWTWVRLAAVGEQVIDDGPELSTGALEDAIASVEREIHSALAELAGAIEADRPIPYRVLAPIASPPRLRPYLAVVRGGLAG